MHLRTLLIILGSVVTCISILLLGDLYLAKGYYLQQLHPLRHLAVAPKSCQSIDFNIHQLVDGSYHLRIHNNSPNIYYYYAYRDGQVIPKSKQVDLFRYTRVKVSSPGFSSKETIGFGCGTGLGLATINPYATTSTERGQEEFLMDASFGQLVKTAGEEHRDIIYDQPITVDPYISPSFISPQDSITVLLYLPIYSVVTDKPLWVHSNPIKLSYLDVLGKYFEGE